MKSKSVVSTGTALLIGVVSSLIAGVIVYVVTRADMNALIAKNLYK